jgi:hypothetical protein
MDPLEEFSRVSGLPVDILADAMYEFSFELGEPIFVNDTFGPITRNILVEKYGAPHKMLQGGEVQWYNNYFSRKNIIGVVKYFLIALFIFHIKITILGRIYQTERNQIIDSFTILKNSRTILDILDGFRNPWLKSLYILLFGNILGKQWWYSIITLNISQRGGQNFYHNLVLQITDGKPERIFTILKAHMDELVRSYKYIKNSKDLSQSAFFTLLFFVKILQIIQPQITEQAVVPFLSYWVSTPEETVLTRVQKEEALVTARNRVETFASLTADREQAAEALRIIDAKLAALGASPQLAIEAPRPAIEDARPKPRRAASRRLRGGIDILHFNIFLKNNTSLTGGQRKELQKGKAAAILILFFVIAFGSLYYNRNVSFLNDNFTLKNLALVLKESFVHVNSAFFVKLNGLFTFVNKQLIQTVVEIANTTQSANLAKSNLTHFLLSKNYTLENINGTEVWYYPYREISSSLQWLISTVFGESKTVVSPETLLQIVEDAQTSAEISIASAVSGATETFPIMDAAVLAFLPALYGLALYSITKLLFLFGNVVDAIAYMLDGASLYEAIERANVIGSIQNVANVLTRDVSKQLEDFAKKQAEETAKTMKIIDELKNAKALVAPAAELPVPQKIKNIRNGTTVTQMLGLSDDADEEKIRNYHDVLLKSFFLDEIYEPEQFKLEDAMIRAELLSRRTRREDMDSY